MIKSQPKPREDPLWREAPPRAKHLYPASGQPLPRIPSKNVNPNLPFGLHDEKLKFKKYAFNGTSQHIRS